MQHLPLDVWCASLFCWSFYSTWTYPHLYFPVMPSCFKTVNRPLCAWSFDPCSHSLFGGTYRFTTLVPFMFTATPFWWCELFLSLSGFFRSSTLLFGVTNRRFGLLAFLFHSHSFLVMLKVCAFLRLVSWLLSFDHVIPRGSKTMQPKLMLSSSISETYRGRVLFRWLTL